MFTYKSYEIDLILFIADSENPSTSVVIAVSVSGILLLLLLLTILLCVFKQRRAKRRAAEVTRDDENPVYGDYYDPDPTMEVEDTNDYYSSGLVD